MILHNMEMLPWTKLSNTEIFSQVFFGAYAFTCPLDEKPSNKLFPFELKDTVYIGRSGHSYDDFFFDRKTYDEDTRKTKFTKYTRVHRRLKDHRHNLLNKNQVKHRETSYKIFYENYGWGQDIVDKVYVSVIVPRKPIPDFRVKVWTLMMENFMIDQYAENFGNVPKMNIDHRLDMSLGRSDENSASFQEKTRVQNSSLNRFFYND